MRPPRVSLGARAQALPRELHGLDDVLVAGAAAEVAGERLADLLVGQVRARPASAARATSGSPACRSRTGGRASRGTPAAADAARPPGGRRSCPRPCAPSGRAAWTANIRQERTGSPVELDRARAADAVLAADVGAGEAGLVADEVREQQPRLDLGRRRWSPLISISTRLRSLMSRSLRFVTRPERRLRARPAAVDDRPAHHHLDQALAVLGRPVDVARGLDARRRTSRLRPRRLRASSIAPPTRACLGVGRPQRASARQRAGRSPRGCTLPVSSSVSEHRGAAEREVAVAAGELDERVAGPRGGAGHLDLDQQLVRLERRRQVGDEEVARGAIVRSPRVERDHGSARRAPGRRPGARPPDRRARPSRRRCRGCGSGRGRRSDRASVSSGQLLGHELRALQHRLAGHRADPKRALARAGSRRARRCG